MTENRSKKQLTGNDSIDGLLLILLGGVLLLWPETLLHVAVMIVGGALVLMGVLACVRYFRSKERILRGLIIGLLMAALGIAMLCASDFFASILYLAVAAMTAFGVVLMAMKVLQRGEKKQTILAIVFGVALLVLAVLIVIKPASFGNFLLRLEGIALIIEGASMLIVKPRQ